MANEISLTAALSAFKPGSMSTPIGRSIQGGLFTMNGVIYTQDTIQVGIAGSAIVAGATNANPIVITTAAPHGMIKFQSVTITGVGGNTNANGTWSASLLSPTTFSIPATGNGAYTSGGTVTIGANKVPMGGVTTPHWSYFGNLDPTNFVQIINGISGLPFLNLAAGEVAFCPLDPSCVPYALANTAPITLEYLILPQ